MAQRNALGRGLDALFSIDEVQTEGSSSINEIELSKITVCLLYTSDAADER